jgi:hypothetical protein
MSSVSGQPEPVLPTYRAPQEDRPPSTAWPRTTELPITVAEIHYLDKR